jgi:hypothetical protein
MITDLKKEKGTADRTSHADPDVTEHNKTPVYAFAASTGVISREYGQAVSPYAGRQTPLPDNYLFEERASHN